MEGKREVVQQWGRFRLLAAILSLAGILAAGMSAQAIAGGNGAGVGHDRGTICRAVDNNGDSWWFSCNLQIVFAPNGAINHHLTGSVIPTGPVAPVDSSPLPSQVVKDFAGQPCLIDNSGRVLTRVVAGVITPSGQVQLTCRS